MQGFSQVFAQSSKQVSRSVAEARCPSLERLHELLEKSRAEDLAIGELSELLEIGADANAAEQFEALRRFSLERWRKPDGNAVRYVAPIYVSSYCVDLCAYCNFSAARKSIARKRLSLEELDVELAAVCDRGARVVELVLATDPEFDSGLLAQYVGRAAEAIGGQPGSGVLLCTEYLSRETYDELRAAGLWGIVQWDETLDREAYDRWHSTSPRKRDFAARIDNHDRAAAAGLETATGALFGLSDYRYDALMQIVKARYLEKEYGRSPFVVGAARLKPIDGSELRVRTEVSDRAYETALLVYRIAAPRAGRWLQTRESFDMNLRNLLDGDVFTYRCGEVTPGGYLRIGPDAPQLKRGQFGVHEIDREYAEARLAAQKFRIDYAWIAGAEIGPARNDRLAVLG